MAEPFVGEIRMMPYGFAPRNWAYCDGSLIPIAQNTILFAVIADYYGGNGQTSMALPDLRGRAPMHAGNGPGLTPRYVSEKWGFPRVELSTDEMPEHSHTVSAYQYFGEESSAGNMLVSRIKAAGFKNADEATGMVPMHSESLKSAGLGAAHENRQPYLVVPFCIALDGVFPVRS
ncbi:phage tail protein [Motilimonas sp. KMU-193]|uniref:phage tail protein n=1 Tax=Motilimonas sp. KMU-193 TaxID=3388668 RepID=UPI00396B06CF